jgi:hypothetical protein
MAAQDALTHYFEADFSGLILASRLKNVRQ